MAVDKSDQNGPYQVLMTFVERSPLWTASLVSPLKSVAEAFCVSTLARLHHHWTLTTWPLRGGLSFEVDNSLWFESEVARATTFYVM